MKKSICDRDDRVRVDDTTSPPYNWICFLLIEAHDGTRWKGTGFKMHLPNTNCMAVVTSGHCTYKEGAYAKQIAVTFSGQETVTVGTEDLYAAPEYINNRDKDYDYGLIILPGNSDVGFSWSFIISEEEIERTDVNICGYPGDKQIEGTSTIPPTMWKTDEPRQVAHYIAGRISYMNATMGGQSGGPVYTWYQGYWTGSGGS